MCISNCPLAAAHFLVVGQLKDYLISSYLWTMVKSDHTFIYCILFALNYYIRFKSEAILERLPHIRGALSLSALPTFAPNKCHIAESRGSRQSSPGVRAPGLDCVLVRTCVHMSARIQYVSVPCEMTPGHRQLTVIISVTRSVYKHVVIQLIHSSWKGKKKGKPQTHSFAVCRFSVGGNGSGAIQ